jgi:hypothetical protein
MIVKIVPVWDEKEEKVVGYRVSVAGETFTVRQVFINDKLEEEPGYDVRFVEAVDVSIYGEDEVLIYTSL